MLENPNALSRGKGSNENENTGHDLAWMNEKTTFQCLVLNLTEQAAQRQSAPFTMLSFDAICELSSGSRPVMTQLQYTQTERV